MKIIKPLSLEQPYSLVEEGPINLDSSCVILKVLKVSKSLKNELCYVS